MLEEIPHIEDFAFNGWSGVVIMLIILGYLYALGISGRQYIKKMSSLGKQRQRMVNYTDEVKEWSADVVLAISVVMSIAMCVFCVAVRGRWMQFGFVNYAVAVGGTVVFLLLKDGLASVVGSVFGISIYVAKLKMKMIYVVFGMLCLIISMLFQGQAGVNVLLISVAGLVVLGVVAEFVILVENFFGKVGSLFYIFLYLCAAEILPITVGLRVIIQVFN